MKFGIPTAGNSTDIHLLGYNTVQSATLGFYSEDGGSMFLQTIGSVYQTACPHILKNHKIKMLSA
jgi:hypothetical protein